METKKININIETPLFGQVRAVTDEQRDKRYHEFVLSNESVDRHGTVFRKNGWQIEGYNRSNPVVTYVHEDNNADPDLVIGTAEVFFEGKEMIGRVYYEPEDINPLAEKIRKKVDHGTLRMASISAIPKEGHFGNESDGEDRDVLYFTNQELIAWSIVPVGSNRQALKRSAEALKEIRENFAKNIQVTDVQDISATADGKNEQQRLSVRNAQTKMYNYKHKQ